MFLHKKIYHLRKSVISILLSQANKAIRQLSTPGRRRRAEGAGLRRSAQKRGQVKMACVVRKMGGLCAFLKEKLKSVKLTTKKRAGKELVFDHFLLLNLKLCC